MVVKIKQNLANSKKVVESCKKDIQSCLKSSTISLYEGNTNIVGNTRKLRNVFSILEMDPISVSICNASPLCSCYVESGNDCLVKYL